MAWDYKNPLPPQRGDGRYNNKFSNTYEVLDCLREHYYDLFKEDLAFNGQKDQKHYGLPENHISAYRHDCKNFASIKDNRPVFTLWLEKGELNNSNNYVEFCMDFRIFLSENNELALQFMKRCISDITNRNFNLVLSINGILKFIHVPYDREIYGLGQFATATDIYYTRQTFIDFIYVLYRSQYFYINMVSEDILSRLNNEEREFLNYLNNQASTIYFPEFEEERKIEVGPKLEYVRIRK